MNAYYPSRYLDTNLKTCYPGKVYYFPMPSSLFINVWSMMMIHVNLFNVDNISEKSFYLPTYNSSLSNDIFADKLHMRYFFASATLL